MTKTTYPGIRAEASDTACLRDLTKLSSLMREFVEIFELSGSFSALTLCIKKKSQGGGGKINILGKYMDNYPVKFYYFLHNFSKKT